MNRIKIILILLILNIYCGSDNTYIVTAPTLLVRSRPTREAEIIGRLKKGDIVKIIEVTDKIEVINQIKASWVKIKFESKFGYVFKGYLMQSSDNQFNFFGCNNIEKSNDHLYFDLKNLSCQHSIKLENPENAYGPPNDLDIDTSDVEYNKRLSNLNLNQMDSDKIFELGYIAFRHNHFNKAEEYLKLSSSKNNVKNESYKHIINYLLAQIYEQRDDYNIAKDYYLKYGDKYYIHIIEAKINENNGNLANAEKEYLLAQSVSLYEMVNYEPFRYLAELFYKHKNYKRALMYIEQYIHCAEYESQEGGEGYLPKSNDHIESANQFIKEIKEKLK